MSKPRVWSGRLFLLKAHANKSLLIPASLYAINGYLKFMMLLFFSPVNAKMIGNLKVISQIPFPSVENIQFLVIGIPDFPIWVVFCRSSICHTTISTLTSAADRLS